MWFVAKKKRVHKHMSDDIPIVLIHGLFGNQSDPEILAAFEGVEVHAPDLIGYGKFKDAQSAGWSLDDQADHVFKFVQELRAPSVHLVGHSVGGAVSALVAFRNSSLVASYTSVEGNFTLKDAFWSGQIAQKSLAEVEEIIRGYRDDPETWMRGAVTEVTPFASRLAREWLDNQPASTIRSQAKAVVAATTGVNYQEKLRALFASDTPTYLIAGKNRLRGGIHRDGLICFATSGSTFLMLAT